MTQQNEQEDATMYNPQRFSTDDHQVVSHDPSFSDRSDNAGRSNNKEERTVMATPLEQTNDAGAFKLGIRDLNFYYGDFHALKDISLDVQERQVTAFIGPSGCGKSTLLRCLNRIHELYPNMRCEGDILLDGQNVNSPDVDAELLRMRVGMVFQRPTPFPMSIRDNVAFGVKLQEKISRGDLQERVEWALRKAALWDEVKDKLNQPGLSLSGGQQQRLCIARTIATRPDVILLDEPTSALDPIATGHIETLIQELVQEYTIVMVTHNMQQAARISNRTVFMYMGEIVEAGLTKRMFSNPRDPRTLNYIQGRFG